MNNFKYYININQYAAIKHFPNLDFNDLAIFSFIQDFAFTDHNTTRVVNNIPYFHISSKLIIEQLPLLGIKTKMGIFKRINKLIDAGLLERCPDNQSLNLSLYKYGDKVHLYTSHKDNENNDTKESKKPSKPINKSLEPINESLEGYKQKFRGPINESLEGYKQKFRGPINKSLDNNNNKNNNTNYYFSKGEKKEEISFDEDSFKTDPENGKLISDYDRTLKEFDTLAELKTILNDKQEYENIRQICFIRGIDNDYTIKCLFFYFASLLPEDKKKRRLVDTRSHFKRWIPKQVEIHTLKGLCETAEKAYKSYVEIVQKQDIIEAIYRIVNENKENGRHPLHGIHNEAYKYTRELYDKYNKEYGLIYAYYDKLIQQKREQEQNQNND